MILNSHPIFHAHLVLETGFVSCSSCIGQDLVLTMGTGLVSLSCAKPYMSPGMDDYLIILFIYLFLVVIWFFPIKQKTRNL